MVEERQKGGDALGGQQTVATSNGRHFIALPDRGA